MLFVEFYSLNGAHNRIRTGDLFLTKEVHYQLCYVGLNGAEGGI